ncbi:hypothetical protein, partial [Cysteiniphilum sp. E12A11]
MNFIYYVNFFLRQFTKKKLLSETHFLLILFLQRAGKNIVMLASGFKCMIILSIMILFLIFLTGCKSGNSGFSTEGDQQNRYVLPFLPENPPKKDGRKNSDLDGTVDESQIPDKHQNSSTDDIELD